MSVINTATNTVTATVPVGSAPIGVSVTQDGTKAYVANKNSNTVSVINTATNSVSATVTVGSNPQALGAFISAPPVVAAPVPTLGEWAIILMAMSLGGIALATLRRREGPRL